ncbi:S-layer homology domain-containing protein [Saccharibacillus sacchari]|uniref:Invasin domain 3-containing protein n=1 Tax=Saccharibacillus sacchari TaxID=456493 RepID=A0ACC6PLB5_9BACL
MFGQDSNSDLAFKTYMLIDDAPFSTQFSTIQSNTSTIQAGTGSTRLTLTLQDGKGYPYTGTEIPTFVSDSQSVKIENVSHAGNVYTADLTAGTMAETVHVSAEIGGQKLDNPVSINVTASAADLQKSSIASTSGKVEGDGKESSTLKVQLRDAYDNPLIGKSIKLMSDSSSSQAQPAQVQTDQAGKATFTVTNTAAEKVTYYAADAGNGTVLTPNTEIQFVYEKKPSIKLTEAPGTDTFSRTINVQATASGGSNTIVTEKWLPGAKTLTDFQTQGAIVTAHRFTVNRDGVYSVYAKDAAGNESVEIITVSAITVPFSTSLSTVAAQSATLNAGGTSIIGINLINEDGKAYSAASDVQIQLRSKLGKINEIKPLGKGQYEATFQSTGKVGEELVSVTADGKKLDQEIQLKILPEAVDAQQSSVTASPESVSADGQSFATVTASVYDKYQNPLRDIEVQLDTDPAGVDVYPQPSVRTDESGRAEFRVTSETARKIGLTLSAMQNGQPVILGNPVQITFVHEKKPEIKVVSELSAGLPITKKVTASADVFGKLNLLETLKWAVGEHPAEYFTNEGTELTNGQSFDVSASGTYTFYARDTSGNVTVKTVDIDVPLSADTALAGIRWSTAAGDPGQPLAYNADTRAYEATVTSDVYSVALTPSTFDPSASVTLNGDVILQGESSKELILQTGENRYDLVVSAQNGEANQSYPIVIVREAVKPEPQPETPEPQPQPPVSGGNSGSSSNTGVTPNPVPVAAAPTSSWNLSGLNGAFSVSRQDVLNGKISLASENAASVASLDSDLVKAWYALNPKAEVTLQTSGGTLSLPVAALQEALGNATGGSAPRTVELSAAQPAESAMQTVRSEAGRLGAAMLTTPTSWSIALTGESSAAAEKAAAALRQAATVRLVWATTETASGASPVSSILQTQHAGLVGTSVAAAADNVASITQTSVSKTGTTAHSTGTLVRWDTQAGTFRFVTAALGAGEVGVPADGGVYAIVNRPVNFSDLSDHWAQKGVEKLASSLIVEGRTASTFDANGTLSRSELAALLVRALGLDASTEAAPFADTADDWYTDAVNTAYAAGLIRGSEDGFRPNAEVTREEMAVMLERALSVQYASQVAASGYALPAAIATSASTSQSAADEHVSSWAEEAVHNLRQLGILQGDAAGKLHPQNDITRAEAAALIVRLLQYGGRM